MSEYEKLDSKWIDEHEKRERLRGPFGNVYLQHVVPSKYLQNLLVPTLSEMETVEITEEPETVADVVTTFWKSFERLKEVMSMEVEELEE